MEFVTQTIAPSNPYYFNVDIAEISALHTGKPHQIVKPLYGYEDAFRTVYAIEKPLAGHDAFVNQTIQSLNNYGYRCDDFTKEHDGLHVLFLGCSVTWGDGLTNEEVWAKKVYDYISSKTKCSGYFNVSFPGIGIAEITYLFNAYVRRFGKPDMVFFGVPNLYRFFGVLTTKDEKTGVLDLRLAHTSDERTQDGAVVLGTDRMNMPARMVTEYVSLNSLSTLETMCQISGIDLYSFTWDHRDDGDLQKQIEGYDFDTMHLFDIKEVMTEVFRLDSETKDEFGLLARDNSHFGTHYHTVWSNRIINDIKDKFE